ncbi:MAG TPA: PaaI family thioesterase [Desulfobacterales bacterium]
MTAENDYKLLPVQDDHMCFACGPANPAGLHMRFLAGRDRVVSRLTIPGHLRGWSNLVHGGVLSTILDEIMSWTAIHLLRRVILTKSMTVNFKKPVYVDTPVKAEGRILRVNAEREAIMEGLLYSPENQLSASATGTFVLIKPRVALKMGIVDETALQGLIPDR